MTGIEDPAKGKAATEDMSSLPNEHDPLVVHPRVSGGLMNSLALIFIGASIGVFWREVFQLTIRVIETFR